MSMGRCWPAAPTSRAERFRPRPGAYGQLHTHYRSVTTRMSWCLSRSIWKRPGTPRVAAARISGRRWSRCPRPRYRRRRSCLSKRGHDNQAFARRFWSGQNAVGRRVGRSVGPPRPGSDSPDLQWSTVVGVVEDARFVSFREAAIPVVFQSTEDVYSPQVTFHIRGASADAARRAIGRIDPGVPVVSVATMSETVDTALLPARIAAFVSGLVGAVVALIHLPIFLSLRKRAFRSEPTNSGMDRRGASAVLLLRPRRCPEGTSGHPTRIAIELGER